MTAILKLFDILPGWCWAAALALAMLGTGVQTMRLSSVRGELQTLQVDLAIETTAASERERAKEAQRVKDVGKVADDAQQKINALESDVAAAGAAADGLRTAANRAARRACSNPAPATTGKGEPDSLALLIDVLGSVGERAGVYAEAADRARIAGAACEASYDKVMGQ